MSIDGYQKQKTWREYQTFFPEKWQVGDDNAPTEEWWYWQGSKVHLDRYDVARASGKVIMLHGGGGYGRMLAPYGYALSLHGWSIVAPDLPGFGLTQSTADQCNYSQWVRLVSDLIEREHQRDGLPIILLGASLGGFLAFASAARSQRVSAVVATTLCDPSLENVRTAFVRSAFIYKVIWPLSKWLVPPPIKQLRLPIRWFGKMAKISNQKALSDLVSRDKFGGGRWVPLWFLESIFNFTLPEPVERFITCPVLLVHPEKDEWTPLALSDDFYSRLKVPKRRVVLESCGHIPVEVPGIYQLEAEVVAFIEKCI